MCAGCVRVFYNFNYVHGVIYCLYIFIYGWSVIISFTTYQYVCVLRSCVPLPLAICYDALSATQFFPRRNKLPRGAANIILLTFLKLEAFVKLFLKELCILIYFHNDISIQDAYNTDSNQIKSEPIRPTIITGQLIETLEA